jgi:hypothetical protein
MKRALYLNGDRWADLGPDQRDLGPLLAIGLFVMFFLAAPFAALAADLDIRHRIDPAASEPLQHPEQAADQASTSSPQHCTVRISPTGYPLPDPVCTPGAVNPTVTIEILRDPHFRTGLLRDNASSAKDKAKTYQRYGIPHPKKNKGKTQTCELDHLCSLELGCADTVDNIWPQCGPAKVSLKQRWFKIKDQVENWLAREVRSGRMDLHEAQHAIASDWSQFVGKVKAKVRAHRK